MDMKLLFHLHDLMEFKYQLCLLKSLKINANVSICIP